MGIHKLSVLAVVLHTCSHTAPHGLIGSRVVTVMTWTGRSEVHIATMLRMLAGEDMVKGSQLVEIGIACLGIPTVQFLGEFQHVVGITGLRAVDILHEVLAGLLAGEVLTSAVTTECQCTLTSHDIPEIGTGIMIELIAREF